MRKYNPRAYHRGGTVRTQMQENFIYNPTNITGQPVEPRGQSTRAIVKLYLSLTLMRRRQYITLLGTSFNAATDRKDRGLYRKSITLPLLPYLSLQSYFPIMYFSATLLFSLAAFAVARPQDAAPAAAGSKKNVYLSTCKSRGLLDSMQTDCIRLGQLLT
jgi:hypothetical protein